jgi:hypothetical protein
MYKKLAKIQAELKVPKNQRNNFGNYNYRNCEDILEAVKPLLAEQELFLSISDEMVIIGERYYVKAHAMVFDGTNKVSTFGYAREAENKKGMDESQITGAASSYARKYALNGLFCIDDTKDADATNKHDKETKQDTPKDSTEQTFDELQKSNIAGKTTCPKCNKETLKGAIEQLGMCPACKKLEKEKAA